MKAFDIVLLILNLAVTAGSNMILKFSTLQVKQTLKLFYLFLGLFLYFSMSLVTLYLYKNYSLILIQGLLTLTYILTPIFAQIFFKEKLSAKIWKSIAIIILGIFIITTQS